MSIDYDFSAQDAVLRKFGALRRRVEHPEKAWPKVGKYLSRQVELQFITEGAHFGRKWKPLKPGYRLWKIRHGYGRKILIQTGDMKESFTRRPMSIEIYRGNTALFGSDNQKAEWHQKGTRRNGKRVNPPRPMLVITPEVRKDVIKILSDYIKGAE